MPILTDGWAEHKFIKSPTDNKDIFISKLNFVNIPYLSF